MITFDKDNHAYYKDGDIKPSVSQILDRVFGSKFDEIKDNPFVIRARDKGTLIHKAIENYVKKGIKPDFPMIEFDNFLKICKEQKIKFDIAEEYLYCLTPYGDYCGTADNIFTAGKLLTDTKTGSKKDIDRWTKQLSLYAKAKNYMGGNIEKIAVIWVHNDINEYIPLQILPDNELNDIIKAYYSNETMKEVVSAELATVNAEISTKISQTIEAIEKLEEVVKLFREAVLSEMQLKGIKKFDNGQISITYIEPTTRVSIDSKKLKEELPDVYSKYSKISDVKASVKISKKEPK